MAGSLPSRQRQRTLEEIVSSSASRRALLVVFALAAMVGARPAAGQQDWFRVGTGLGQEKPRVAVADFTPRSDTAKSHGALFTQVVRDDLAFSGILDLVSPSFYPQSQPSAPNELRYVSWTDSPVNAHFVAFGNLSETTGEVAIEAWFYDVTNPSTQAVIAKVYRGTPSDQQVRKFAHQFADEIIRRRAGAFFHADCLCQLPRRCKRDLGDGLRRSEPACHYFPAFDCADAALVSGQFAN